MRSISHLPRAQLQEEGNGIGQRFCYPGNIAQRLALDVRIGHPTQQRLKHAQLQIHVGIWIDVMRHRMRDAPRAEVHHAQIEGVHLPIVATMEVIMRHDHRPAQSDTGENQCQETVIFGTSHSKQVGGQQDAQMNQLKSKITHDQPDHL